jgi:hypothetical protein
MAFLSCDEGARRVDDRAAVVPLGGSPAETHIDAWSEIDF